jgi:26S proteasome non-ATPase regulatory subunit 10
VVTIQQANPRLSKLADDDGRLPIHWAVSYNQLSIVKLLMEHTPDFDPDVQDSLGWTPLMMSASRPEGTELATLLIAKGANVNEKSKEASYHPPHFPSLYFLNNFVMKWFADLWNSDNNNQTALHFAVSKLTLPTITLLLTHKASPRIRDKRLQLPIHRAAASGSVPILKRLLHAGSPLDNADIDGCTPLHHAIAEGHGDAALFLILEGADTSKKDSEGTLALDTAPDAKVRSFILDGARNAGWEDRIWSVVEEKKENDGERWKAKRWSLNDNSKCY